MLVGSFRVDLGFSRVADYLVSAWFYPRATEFHISWSYFVVLIVSAIKNIEVCSLISPNCSRKIDIYTYKGEYYSVSNRFFFLKTIFRVPKSFCLPKKEFLLLIYGKFIKAGAQASYVGLILHRLVHYMEI